MPQIKLSDLPELPGVYKFFNSADTVIYVGKAKNLKRRVSSYFSKKTQDAKTNELVKNINYFDVIITKDEYSALLLENELIKKYWPKYNIALKDDKNYPSIITNKKHPYPRLDYHTGTKKPGNEYFGPYTDRYAVKSMLRELQKLFQVRSCSDYQFNQHKACLLHQIKRCSAPCEAKISNKDYQSQYKQALLFIQGKHTSLLNQWQQEMLSAAENEHYEKAAYYRDLIQRCHKLCGKDISKDSLDIVVLAHKNNNCHLLWLWVRDGMIKGKQEFKVDNPMQDPDTKVLETIILQRLTSMPSKFGFPAKILVDLPIKNWQKIKPALGNKKIELADPNAINMQRWLEIGQQNLTQMLKQIDVKWADTVFNDPELTQILELPSPPKHTECFDISHTAGKQVYASCVVFNETGPNKKLYRTYKIPFDEKPDDYLALKYVFEKRFAEPKQIPDLIIVDGGKGQLNILLKALKDTVCQDIPVLAISKGPSRKEGEELLHTRLYKDFKVSRFNQALFSLLFIRNEAHRFALKQHRKARAKQTIKFTIENVPGISAKKRQALYNHFGGLAGLKEASVKDIAKVPGIGPILAKKIRELLDDV